MIVDCARCRTRFHLDDARVPAGGVQVRCSRCKHAFVLKPPEPARPDEPTQLKEPPPPAEPATREPEPAAEAAAPPGAELFDFGGGANPDENGSEDESDWEFNTDFPDEDESAPPALEAPSAAPPATEDEESLSLDDVGSPEEWDLLGEDSVPVPGEPDEQAPPAASAPGALSVEDAVTSAPRPHREPPPPGPRPRAASPGRPVRGLSLPGWVATAFLLLVAGHGGLRISAQPVGVVAPDTTVTGLRVEDLRGRRVENAYGPMLYVVSGRLTNPGQEARSPGALVVVELAGANGRPIPGHRAAAGGALASDVLREAEPTRLRAQQERSGQRLAGLSIPPGESIRFDAVFEALPATAAQLRFETRELPATAADEGAPQAPTTSSSPPSAPPSWE